MNSTKAKSFPDIEVGDNAQFDIIITEEMHNSFSKLVGDYSPIHCDEEFCSRTKFNKKLGFAFQLTGFLSRLYGEYLPGGSSICIKQDAKFIKPFFIGDEIKIIGTVVNKIVSTQFLEIKTEMYRNGAECIFKGLGIVQVFERRLLQPLYKFNMKGLYYSDFVDSLKEIGVENRDVIFVHSDISVFGKLCTSDRDFLLKTVYEAIKDSVGDNGTIIMPTFTYSFCNGEIYDIVATPSTVGILTEYFRKQSDVYRTIHPIFSVGVWGKHRDTFMDISKDSFGQDSVFGKLHKLKGKIIFLGAPFQSCTYIHYIEQMHGIPYRYMKTFDGEIQKGDVKYRDKSTFFVRNEENVIFETNRLEEYLLENGFMKEVHLGNGRILMIKSEILFDECWRLLDKDIYFIVKKDAIGNPVRGG